VKDASSYYDDFSHTYDDARHSGYHAHIDDLETACVRRWLRGGRVLEVGCGTGLLLTRVRNFAPGAVGMDISLGMLRRAAARGHAVSQASVTALPCRDRSFDLAFSFKVLPHVEDLDRGLAEIARVLDDGGVGLLEFYNPRSLRGLWKRIRWWNASVGRASHDREVYTTYHTPEEARRRVAAHLEVCGHCGVVLLTPHPVVHRIPLLGGLLRVLERALSNSALARWAGFYVVVARKRGTAAAGSRRTDGTR
jgi:ubiquinone/menaquinone biosynthesis C-methylase UbiE